MYDACFNMDFMKCSRLVESSEWDEDVYSVLKMLKKLLELISTQEVFSVKNIHEVFGIWKFQRIYIRRVPKVVPSYKITE